MKASKCTITRQSHNETGVPPTCCLDYQDSPGKAYVIVSKIEDL
jgi:hypothetical protein